LTPCYVNNPEASEELWRGGYQSHVAAAAADGTVPRYAVPGRVTFVDSLERTSVGKLNKRLLRERFA
jgi:fatty-acyl-CoA synthase